MELICKIAVVAEQAWRAERLDKCAVNTQLDPSPLINQGDCRGVTSGLVKACLRDGPLELREPAASLMQTCRRLRDVLKENKAAWKEVNTLLHAFAILAGPPSAPPLALAAAGARFSYGSTVFDANNVCSCVMAGLDAFFATLSYVRMSLPWADPSQRGHTSVAHFFPQHHSQEASPLVYFNLDLHEDIYITPEFLLALRSPRVQTCIVKNASIFFFGLCLEVLSITFPFCNLHYFGPSLLNALTRCPNLQSFTFDGGHCEIIESALGDTFNDELPATVHLRALRYLRLLLPTAGSRELLMRLVLPAGIDIHLEPVLTWSAPESALYQTEEAPSGQAFADDDLWQYAAAIVAPASARDAFMTPSQFTMPAAGSEWDVLQAVSTITMDVRSTLRDGREPGDRIPDMIRFTASTGPLEAPSLDDGDRVTRGAAVAQSRSGRSLTVRHAGWTREEPWNGRPSVWPTEVGCAAIEHVARTFIRGRKNTPYQGLGLVRALAIDEDSWVPTASQAWERVLAPFDDITDLTILCHKLCVAQLEGLATCLRAHHNTSHPLPALQTLRLSGCPLGDTPAVCARRMEIAVNGPSRRSSGAADVRCVVGA